MVLRVNGVLAVLEMCLLISCLVLTRICLLFSADISKALKSRGTLGWSSHVPLREFSIVSLLVADGMDSGDLIYKHLIASRHIVES